MALTLTLTLALTLTPTPTLTRRVASPPVLGITAGLVLGLTPPLHWLCISEGKHRKHRASPLTLALTTIRTVTRTLTRTRT